MTIDAVMFDFSGTLFRLEEDESWYRDLVNANGRPFDVHETAEIMRRMTAPVGRTVELDEAGRHAWEHRDLDPALHREAYVKVLLASGVPDPEQAARLYGRLVDPGEWEPYPDAGKALELLAERDVPVAVVSNIAFDLRPAFAARGWDRFVRGFVLSFEVGVMKPQPEIFRAALDALGARAEATLMVGDSAVADGGATALGCAFAEVEPLPTVERPDGLLAALAAHGLA